MSDADRHIVRLSEIAAHPWGRIDAGYWMAPDAVRAVMDEKPSWTRERAERELDQRRRITDADAAIQFLLDGLAVESLNELRALTLFAGVAWAKLDRIAGYGRRGDWDGLREYVLLNLLAADGPPG